MLLIHMSHMPQDSKRYCWVSIILCPILGATLAIIIKMNIDTAVILSALIAVFYTWIGNDFNASFKFFNFFLF